MLFRSAHHRSIYPSATTVSVAEAMADSYALNIIRTLSDRLTNTFTFKQRPTGNRNTVEDEETLRTSRDDVMWWKASKQRIQDYISRIPTSSESEASPIIAVRRRDEPKSVEILTNSNVYKKRLDRATPELQKLVQGKGYKVLVTYSASLGAM